MTLGFNTGDIKVAIAGLGAIGWPVAQALDAGRIPGCRLAAVAARDAGKAQAQLQQLSRPVPLVPLESLPEHADVVVECLPPALLKDVAAPALAAGKTVVVLSVGGLLRFSELLEQAKHGRGRILVPSGAALGLDALAAAAEGEINAVKLVTRKPPAGFKGAALVEEQGIDLDELTSPLKLFEGSARDAARDFPSNLNVAVSLALAGIGPDRTRLEVWADPGVSRNTHSIEVESDSSILRMQIENLPSENPKTSRITALSVLALLRKLAAPVRVGT